MQAGFLATKKHLFALKFVHKGYKKRVKKSDTHAYMQPLS